MRPSKKHIYDILRTALDGVDVMQGSTAQFSELPAVTFTLAHQQNHHDLDGEYTHQDVVYKVDVWAGDTAEAEALLRRTSDALAADGWAMEAAADIPNPQDDIVHISARYRGVVC